MAPTKDKEERKLTLPSGHPQAGYVSPDLSGMDGVGTLPDEEQKIHDERDDAREAEVEAVAEHEDKVAREEIKAREDAEKAAEKSAAKAEPKSSAASTASP